MTSFLSTNLITTKDAGELSGYTPDYLARLAKSGKIVGKRIGHSWLVEKESLLAFMDAQGTQKIEKARSLAEERAKEYRAHRSLINRATKSLLQTPRSGELVKLAPASFTAPFVALATALLVVVTGVFAAESHALPQLAASLSNSAHTVALGFTDTFGDIPQNLLSKMDATRSLIAAKQSRVAEREGEYVVPVVSGEFGFAPVPVSDALEASHIAADPFFTAKTIALFNPDEVRLSARSLGSRLRAIAMVVPNSFAPVAHLGYTSFSAAATLTTQAPAFIEDQYLALLGKSAVALANIPQIAAALPALSVPEKIALSVYETLTSVFHTTQQTFASLFNPPRITLIPPTPTASSTPTVITTYPTYTTVVQGVSHAELSQALAEARTNILASVSSELRPIATQTQTNITTIQQISKIEDLTNLIVRNGDFRGGTFDEGVITDASSISATTATFSSLTVSGAATFSTSTISGSFAVGTTSPLSSSLFTVGTSSPLLYIDSTSGRIGVGTTSPAVTFDIYASDALRLPTGTTAQRPSSSGVGFIRYNTSTSQFEGYGAAGSWQAIGGALIDTDQDTYISADTDSLDEDFLRFFTKGTEQMVITDQGLLGLASTSPYAQFGLHLMPYASSTIAFAIGSSTAAYATSTLFSIDNRGNLTAAGGATFAGPHSLPPYYIAAGNTASQFPYASSTGLSVLSSILVGTTSTTTIAGDGNASTFFGPLSVKGTANQGSSLTMQRGNSNGDNSLFFTDQAGTTLLKLYTNANTGHGLLTGYQSYLDLGTSAGGTALSIDTSGNVNATSHLVPTANQTYSLGSASKYWNNLYANNIISNSFSSASTSITGVNNVSFSVNSDNPTADAQDMSLIFYRGAGAPSNAVISWNSTLKRFEFNQNAYIANATASTASTTLTIAGVSSQTAALTNWNDSSGNTLVTVTAAGKVGIGTSSPGVALTVEGAGTNSQLRLGRSTDFIGQNTLYANSIQALGLLNGANTEVLSVTQSGTVGVGSTTPWATFAVNPLAGIAANQFVIGSSTGTSFVVSNAGYVGIGTTTPGSLLSVQGVANFSAATSTLYMTNGINLNGGCFAISGSCINPPALSGSTGQLAYFSGTNTQSATSSLFLASSGNFGIGTSVPYAKLSVEGSATNLLELVDSASSTVLLFRRMTSSQGTSSTTIVYLTSGTSWNVPSDWSSASNTIEVIGGGGGGGSSNGGASAGGGGGGGYSKKSNVSLTAGGTVTYSVGSAGAAGSSAGNGGAGGATYFCNSTSNCASIGGSAVVAGANGGGGGGASGGAAGSAGSTSGAVGDVKYAGGAGGPGDGGAYDGGGGGGSGGPHGTGGAGAGPVGGGRTGNGGGGGGGGSAGSLGSTSHSVPGGAGGNNHAGTGGGYSATLNDPAASGTAGGGGQGGNDVDPAGSHTASGGAGGAGTEWEGTRGSGGGGGGAGQSNRTGVGGAGGLYGGGGGGTGANTNGLGGAGAQGIIVITYDAVVQTSFAAVGLATSSPWGQFSINPSGVSGPAFVVGSSTGTNFIVDNGGFVGIGTSSPGTLLSVQGIGNFTAATSTLYMTNGINLSGGCFATNGSCISPPALSGTTGQLSYFTDTNVLSATSNLFLSSAQNFAIGTTSPYAKLSVVSSSAVTYLVVGGGGGGGANRGGGGGGGGFKTGNIPITVQSYTVTVGAGGAGGPTFGGSDGSKGSDSVFSTITAEGGGFGAYKTTNTGGSGGSGGGGAQNPAGGGSGGTASAGFAGGTGGTEAGNTGGAGGGGGAGVAGSNGSSSANGPGGGGGNGLASSISGTSVTYAGGGGGGGYNSSGGTGGSGGGASGTGTDSAPSNATANTGGGGGGGGGVSTGAVGSAGGSGIVIISAPAGVISATGGSKTTVGGRDIWTFTATGSTSWTVTAINPFPLLHLVDNASTTLATIQYDGSFGLGTSSPWGQFSINPSGISGPAFVVGSSTGTNFIVDNGGNVGIGTSSPGSLLSVQGVGNFTTATSTLYSSGYVNLTGGGCYSINGTCLQANISGTTGQLNYFTGTNTQAATSSLFLASSGNFSVGTTTAYSKLSVWGNATVNYLVVAGGGGGGGSSGPGGGRGGGGAGGFRTGSLAVTSQSSYTVTIGSGGAGGGFEVTGTSGGASAFSSISSAGGGGGGAGGSGGEPGGSGGSGGGAAQSGTGGAGNTPSTAPSQGNNGGNGGASSGGGGGGAGAVGATASGANGGNGGTGTASSISGASVTYSCGGGAAGYPPGGGSHGTGGCSSAGSGSSSGTPDHGDANRGGGGGGGQGGTVGGDGGSGIVIISAPVGTVTNASTAGGTHTTSGDNDIWTFTSTGTWTPTFGSNLLQLVDNASTTLAIIQENGSLGLSTSTPWGQFSINPSGITGPAFVIGSSSATSFIVDNGGFVGIGTSSPGSLLSVQGVGNFTTATSSFNAAGNINLSGGGCFATNGTCLQGNTTGTTGQLSYFTGTNTQSATSSLFLASSGNFSVGTTTSYAKLTLWSPPPSVFVQVLVVAGGGAGASGAGGGGGAGGVVYHPAYAISPGAGHTVTVGAGGASAGGGGQFDGGSGSNSVFGAITANGGGGGAGGNNAGINGGSGGGGGRNGGTAGTTNQTDSGGGTGYGNNGGNGLGVGGGHGGGGGGAGAVGSPGNSSNGGAGGAGQSFNISGVSTTYGGGGGGGVCLTACAGSGAGGSGGSGGGGGGSSGGNGTAGTANTGGGGGSGGADAAFFTGGDGGSGIVIISAPVGAISSATGGTKTTVGGNDIWTFTSSGTWTPTFTRSTPFMNLLQLVDNASTTLAVIKEDGSMGLATTTPWGQFSINPNGISGPAFVVGSSTGTNFIVDNGGFVGIGTSSPGTLLSVQGIGNFTTATSTLYLANAINLSAGGCFATNGTCLPGNTTGTTGQLSYFTGTNTQAATSSLFLSTAGNFSLGTTTAYSKLTVWKNPPTVTVDYLVVGGGGGGSSGSAGGGGGGAGGFRTGTLTTSFGSYSVVVGAGGVGAAAGGENIGSSGATSTFATISSNGGGAGGNEGSNGAVSPIGNGLSGGSGGGGRYGGTGGTGNMPATSPSQGNAGGSSTQDGARGGGGGGGASAVGANGDATNGGNGGAGTASSISGASVTYAGGGGGGKWGGGVASSGGAGGGGAGQGTAAGTAGTANTGGGGGGTGGSSGGGAGGSGIVIISATAGTISATGGTKTTSGGNDIWTFTASGTWTVDPSFNLLQLVDNASTTLAVIQNNGSLGLGTSTPWGQFSINPNGITGPAFVIGSSTGTNFIVDNGGNVGIGTSTPGTLLSIQGIGNFTAATSTLYLANAINLSGGGCFATNGSCLPANTTGTTGQLSYFTGTNTQAATSSLFLASSGNFSVGTTTSYSKLTVWSNFASKTLSYLVVAGGGGTGNYMCGGGAGAVRSLSGQSLSSGSYTVTVGAGGTGPGPSGNGGDSSFNGLISLGGGGGRNNVGNGNAGGSGSGACTGTGSSFTGGAGSTGGNAGGNVTTTGTRDYEGGGGGGGAGAVGANGGGATGGNGGNGIASSISGASVTYGGGGGGSGGFTAGASTGAGGTGGTGGGGNGGAGNAAGNNGTDGLGGGAGASGPGSAVHKSGGSGVVIISAPIGTIISATGGTHTTSGGNDIWTFTSSGTWAPTFAGLSLPNLLQLVDNASTTLAAINSDGTMGLGTTTPWGQFSINPNGISGPAFVIGSSSATNFIVDNAGNVGIGTSSPGSLLSVQGVGNFTAATSTLYLSNALNLTGGGCFATNGVCASNLTGTTGQLSYLSATDTKTATSSLFLSAAGNFGVGTISPYSKLTVQGSLHLINSASSTVFWAGGTLTRIFLTTGTSWTVPSDWNSSNNTIEVIGGGGGGGAGQLAVGGGGGGGGGAYSKKNNISLTPGGSVNYSVGTAGSAGSGGGGDGTAGGDTFFCSSTSNCASISGTAVVVGAKGGSGGQQTSTTGTGGSSGTGVGDTKYSGGTGGSGAAFTSGGGGGGAAGPYGAGGNGGTASGNPNDGAGGGGGSGGGTAGSNGSGNIGGNGGNNYLGTGGGTGGNTSVGGDGTNGGGGGGGGTNSNTGKAGGAGGAGTEWDATHGSGGGGGGASGYSGGSGNGGAGANYGAAGGGGWDDGVTVTDGGAGAQGVIVVTYYPLNAGIGLGTTTPWGQFSINPNGITGPAFVVGSSSATSFIVDNGGRVGIGTTTPDRTLAVNGNITFKNLTSSAVGNYLCLSATNEVITNTTACTLSSERWKTNISSLAASTTPSLLSEVLALNPVSFNFTPGYGDGGAREQVGFIAEQAATIDSRLVPFDENGLPSGFNYTTYTAVLTGAFHELAGALDITNALTGTSTLRSVYAGTTSPAITVDASGRVGIGTNTPNYALQVSGDIGAISFVNTSTRTAKTDISYADATSTQAMYEKLLQLKVASYRYKIEDQEDPLRLGFISEDVQTIAPEILSIDGKGVDLYKLATFTLGGVQTLAARVQEHETRIATLEDRITALESGAISSSSGTPSFSSGTLASALEGFGVLIEKGIAQFNTLVFRELVASKDADGTSSAGTIIIAAGNTDIQITNALVKPSTKILIAFRDGVSGSWWVSEKGNGFFRITLSEPQLVDVSFNYFLIQTEGQTATSTPIIQSSNFVNLGGETLTPADAPAAPPVLEIAPSDTASSTPEVATSTPPLETAPDTASSTPPLDPVSIIEETPPIDTASSTPPSE